jgi:putative phosphoesterase
MELTLSKFEGADELKIGILADTHGLLRPEAISALEKADIILHGGDVGDEDILDHLAVIAPVYTVRGNVDYQQWCGRLPDLLTLKLGDLKICMIHDIANLDPGMLDDVALVVYGHSHRPEILEKEGVVYLNPGSAGPRRFSLPVTLARLQWKRTEKLVQPELIHLI